MKKIGAKTVALLCAIVTLTGFGGCKPKIPDSEMTVYMPDGAPALALAQMMAQDEEGDGITYRVVPASLIASKVTNKDKDQNADFCVMPLTAATKLLSSGAEYQMLGTVTHGNLYLLAKEGSYTSENLHTLIGKKIGVLQINEVPGLTLKAVLNKYQIPWQEVGNDGGIVEDKVNLVAISGPDAVGTIAADCYMIAEPAASAQAKKGYVIVGDLQSLYGGEKGYPQAVLVAKRSVVETYADWTADFVEKISSVDEWLQTASSEVIVQAVAAHIEDPDTTTSLKAPLLNAAVLGRCGIRFTHASADKAEVNEFVSSLLAINGKAAAMPANEFFWDYTP